MYHKTASILRQQGLAPSKKMGQNFLVHAHTAQRIAEFATVASGGAIIEVGVGLGALTAPLAALTQRVIGIEADSGIVRLHSEQQGLPANVELRHGDILKTDLAKLAKETGGPLTIVSNLPYSISSPFLFHLIRYREWVARAVVMVQKELADRLQALPGTKAYGAPTVLLAACASVRQLLRVKPEEFHPRPRVDSEVIRIDFLPIPERVKALPLFDWDFFNRLVHAGFGQRRKTLVNSLHTLGVMPDKQLLIELIGSIGISPAVRAEALTLEQFVTLSILLDNASLSGRHNI